MEEFKGYKIPPLRNGRTFIEELKTHINSKPVYKLQTYFHRMSDCVNDDYHIYCRECLFNPNYRSRSEIFEKWVHHVINNSKNND